jgi:hypothetical protein
LQDTVAAARKRDDARQIYEILDFSWNKSGGRQPEKLNAFLSAPPPDLQVFSASQ